MSEIFTTTVRLNLTKDEDRRAWAYLQTMDRERYKSYTCAVVTAINDHFSRQERLAADPYLETREKEDAFLQRVQGAVERGIQSANANSLGTTEPATSPIGFVLTSWSKSFWERSDG